MEEFFADRRPDVLLVAHFSCHGVKDEDGELYFAASNTWSAVRRDRGGGRVREPPDEPQPFAAVALLLDCCDAGAFERGMTARAGAGSGSSRSSAGGAGGDHRVQLDGVRL